MFIYTFFVDVHAKLVVLPKCHKELNLCPFSLII
jgi:hypothetical protein